MGDLDTECGGEGPHGKVIKVGRSSCEATSIAPSKLTSSTLSTLLRGLQCIARHVQKLPLHHVQPLIQIVVP